MKKDKKVLEHVTCECGYHNQPWNIMYFGTCRRCGKILDGRANFKYVMNKKLRLWRGKLR